MKQRAELTVPPPSAVAPLLRAFIVFVVTTLASTACRMGQKPTDHPEPERSPFVGHLEAQRDESSAQLLYRAKAPEGHGYHRGRLLALYTPIGADGDRQVVGYGRVLEAAPRTVSLVADYLPVEHRDGSLEVAPFPDGQHVGHRIGKVLRDEGHARWRIDVGEHNGVRWGDVYQVLGDGIVDGSTEGIVLDREVVGLIKVVKVKGHTSVVMLEHGKVPRGAWVELLDAELPAALALATKKRPIRILFLNTESGAQKDDDVLRSYLKNVRNLLVDEGLGDDGQLVVPTFETWPAADYDRTQQRAVALGKEHGAELVVWGTARCADDVACIIPRVTFVDETRFGERVREWEEQERRIREVVSKDGETFDMDRHLRSLASWL
ncbi:MAG: hypothetical protein K0V04_13365, partial [Deltaproteobacteria bacterium]|nr:hypothetical protein [Deltaproteobacteria bacterium]